MPGNDVSAGVSPGAEGGRRVLVVGAGLAGLAAARSLSDQGADVEVVDRRDEPDTNGAGMFLPGNAVRALRQLGLDEAVVDAAVRIDRQRITDRQGRVLYELPTADLWQGIAPTVALHRSVLHDVMLEATKDVRLRWHTAPSSIGPQPDGVEVVFDDGTTSRYDLVVGADGVHSAVRRSVFAGETSDGETTGDGLRPVGLYAWRFVAPRHAEDTEWCVRLGRGKTFLTIPIGADLTYHYLDVSVHEAGADLPDLVAHFGAPVLERVAAATLVHDGPLEEVNLSAWSRDAVVLVGDAAHAMTTSMAQGAAMAFEDAVVLGQVFGSGVSVQDELREYEVRRRPRVEQVRHRSRRRDQARGSNLVLRNLLLRTVGPRMFHADYRGLHPVP